MEKWINSPEFKTYIRKVAKYVVIRMQRDNLIRYHIGGMASNPTTTLTDEIESDLQTFVIQQLYASSDSLALKKMSILINAFYQRFLDKLRNKGVDNSRFLYRQIRKVLTGSARFYTNTDNRFVAFSRTWGDFEFINLDHVNIHIEYPYKIDGSLSYEQIKGRKTIENLCGYFWDQVRSRYAKGNVIWIYVRYVSNWLLKYIVFEAASFDQIQSFDNLPKKEEPSASFEDEIIAGLDEKQIFILAQTCVKGLSERQKRIVYLIYSGLTFEEAAGQLGYAGHSGAKHAQSAALKKIRNFMSDKPFSEYGKKRFMEFLFSAISPSK